VRWIKYVLLVALAATAQAWNGPMSYDPEQFRDLIERTLKKYQAQVGDAMPGFYSEAAVNLLLGTAAQESRFGTYFRQCGGGPALSPFQIEPKTFEWLQEKYHNDFVILRYTHSNMLETNLDLSILVARLRYRAVPKPLPPADSVTALAAYYKKFYNSPLGKATVTQFIDNYKRYVGTP
jgi:hypothetical protein